MTYDEFSEKLEAIKKRYEERYGKEMETVKDLEDFLLVKKLKPRRRGLKSLKGFSI